jgi:hypothetical protein
VVLRLQFNIRLRYLILLFVVNGPVSSQYGSRMQFSPRPLQADQDVAGLGVIRVAFAMEM